MQAIDDVRISRHACAWAAPRLMANARCTRLKTGVCAGQHPFSGVGLPRHSRALCFDVDLGSHAVWLNRRQTVGFIG